MSELEDLNLEKCLKEIEVRYFPKKTSNGFGLKQRDFELLIDLIEKQSGITLSLSTIKRLWKKEYRSSPHPHTLNALATLLGFEDWYAYSNTQELVPKTAPNVRVSKKYVWALALFGLLVLTGLVFWGSQGKTMKELFYISPNTSFDVDKTVTSGVPNTVIFSYDLMESVADSFFIQRSWNPATRTHIDPKEKYLTEVYYFPGFHWARLMADDSVIREKRIHVKTEGWLATAKYKRLDKVPVYLNKDNLEQNGALRISEENFDKSGFDLNKEKVLSYYNIREFDGVGSDHFMIEARLKMDGITGICSIAEMTVIDEQDASWVSITSKGCEGNLRLKVGNSKVSGINNDLSGLGTELTTWQRFRLIINNGRAKIYLNDKLVRDMSVDTGRGGIMGLIFTFTGNGVIDYVRLQDLESNQSYTEEF